ncbi:hypothetical protein ACFL0F_01875, partial [Patescibacteria group bacterium]
QMSAQRLSSGVSNVLLIVLVVFLFSSLVSFSLVLVSNNSFDVRRLAYEETDKDWDVIRGSDRDERKDSGDTRLGSDRDYTSSPEVNKDWEIIIKNTEDTKDIDTSSPEVQKDWSAISGGGNDQDGSDNDTRASSETDYTFSPEIEKDWGALKEISETGTSNFDDPKYDRSGGTIGPQSDESLPGYNVSYVQSLEEVKDIIVQRQEISGTSGGSGKPYYSPSEPFIPPPQPDFGSIPQPRPQAQMTSIGPFQLDAHMQQITNDINIT